MTMLRTALALLVAATAAATAAQAAPPSAAGEYSRTRVQPAPTWKLAGARVLPTATLRYREVAPRRLLEFQRANAAPRLKATRIGFARKASLEAVGTAAPALRWVPVAGGAVARMEVRSPDALALRVGLDVRRLDGRVELRFAGSDDPRRVVALVTVAHAQQLPAGDGLYWTPSTDGESQIIEIFRPAGVPAARASLHAPAVSHLLANSRNDFKIVEKIGESGSCNVDTACRVGELGQHFVNAKNAVAHMQFVENGSTYICTGTLLADTTPSTQVPYFYSANHCFSEGAPVPSAVQQVANTLNTFWNYEATACGSGVSTARTQLAGGATYLYSDAGTDGMLLRLNNPAPAGAYFAAWNAGPLAPSSAVLAIHHPRGDAKKVSSGQHVSSDSTQHAVGWLSGTTEGGSSGSGLFTLARSGYELRGGLYGGSASCDNDGSLSNPGNRDYYSRLDVLFPNVRHYLAADPVEMNGSAPLIPPASAASAQSAPSQAATPAPRRPALRDALRETQRRRAMQR
jgi:hypothetical protein